MAFRMASYSLSRLFRRSLCLGDISSHGYGHFSTSRAFRTESRWLHDESVEGVGLRDKDNSLISRSAGQGTEKKEGQEVRPFSDFLTDAFRRQHDYLRISVTERCNLRCLYCMPEEGVPLSPPRELLTTPEIVFLSSVFVSEGVKKIRLTGGEPTVRRDIVSLMQQIGELRRQGLKELCLTTNGLSLHRKLDAMVDAGLTGVNLSLDTLDPFQFHIMTRRKGFDAVRRTMDRILEMNRGGAGIKFKINCVVMRGINQWEMVDFVELTRENKVEVRFIEYMPFDGNKWSAAKMFSYAEMVEAIRIKYPTLERLTDEKNDTSKAWHVPGFEGKVGFITSMTENFCGTCNRLRITGDGNLKVCLFGNAEVSLRDLIRKANGGEPIDQDGSHILNGMTRGQAGHELLHVIGMAVKRKKARHAGMGELQHMKNRPMILIGLTGPPVLASIAASVAARSTGRMAPHNRPRPRHSQVRYFANVPVRFKRAADQDIVGNQKLTHVSESGSARMVNISGKAITSRVAVAKCRVLFSSALAGKLIRESQMKKGDVVGVARIAGIMAAKKAPDLIPLCHPISISEVSIDLDLHDDNMSMSIRATVACCGKTGVEMEALTAASASALTVYDMCKAADKAMVIGDMRIVLKDGGKSGRWEMP